MPAANPLHIDNLKSNLAEVLRLVEIHALMTGSRPGRRRNVSILNKSGIVLAVSCWEAFVEDLASHGFDCLLQGATTPSVFPRKVLTLASKELRESQDTRRVWELADSGWRSILEKHKNEILARSVGRLNTPRPKQVDELFGDLLGIQAFSSSWKWHNVTNQKIKESLEQLVTLRGEIAHRVVSSTPVRKGDVTNAVALVERLATSSSNLIRQFLMTRLPAEPWQKFGDLDDT